MKIGKVVPIMEIGNAVLRRKPRSVTFPLQKETRQIIENMFSTMQASDGVGIAAPQINVSLQIIIIASRPNARYPYAPIMKPVVMINPKIIRADEATNTGWEGCLSVPNIRGLVPCSNTVKVTYQNLMGTSRTRTFSDFPARIIQHEVSHLQGLLFTDRVQTPKDLYSQKEFLKRLQRSSKTKMQKS
jgi:peptide deformylase